MLLCILWTLSRSILKGVCEKKHSTMISFSERKKYIHNFYDDHIELLTAEIYLFVLVLELHQLQY